MSRFLLLVLFLLLFYPVAGQDKDTTYWKRSFESVLNFDQAAFSSNWTGGGTNSIGLNGLINFKADYKKGRHSWDNYINMVYGFVNTGNQGFRKNNDRLFIDTKYGYQLGPKWNMTVAFNALTQFAPGYKYEKDSLDRDVATLISKFLAPGYFTLTWGFEWVPKPFFKLRLSPFSPRMTVVTDTTLYHAIDNNYGVDIGKTTRMEWLAMQIMADFDKDLSENLNLKFKYILFYNMQTPVSEIDHRFDLALTAKIAKYFNVKLTGTLIYDVDQDASVQLSEGIGIGFIYLVKNYKDEK